MPDKRIASFDPMTGAPIYEDGTRGEDLAPTSAEASQAAGKNLEASAELPQAPEEDDTIPTLGGMIETLNMLIPEGDNMSAASPSVDAAVASSAALTAKAFLDARQNQLEDDKDNCEPQCAAPLATQTASDASDFTRAGYTAPRRSTAPTAPPPAADGDFAPESCAGFFTRFFAFLIDSIIASLMAFVVSGLLSLIFGSAMDEYVLFSISLASLIRWVVVALYFILLTGFTGMTAGKRLLRIKVLAANGQKAGWWSVVYRETVGRYLNSLLCVGYLVLAFDKRHRGFHDMLADTRVVLCS